MAITVAIAIDSDVGDTVITSLVEYRGHLCDNHRLVRNATTLDYVVDKSLFLIQTYSSAIIIVLHAISAAKFPSRCVIRLRVVFQMWVSPYSQIRNQWDRDQYIHIWNTTLCLIGGRLQESLKYYFIGNSLAQMMIGEEFQFS